MVSAKELVHKKLEFEGVKTECLCEIQDQLGANKIQQLYFMQDLTLGLKAQDYLNKDELNVVLDKGFKLLILSSSNPFYIFYIPEVFDND